MKVRNLDAQEETNLIVDQSARLVKPEGNSWRQRPNETAHLFSRKKATATPLDLIMSQAMKEPDYRQQQQADTQQQSASIQQQPTYSQHQPVHIKQQLHALISKPFLLPSKIFEAKELASQNKKTKFARKDFRTEFENTTAGARYIIGYRNSTSSDESQPNSPQLNYDPSPPKSSKPNPMLALGLWNSTAIGAHFILRVQDQPPELGENHSAPFLESRLPHEPLSDDVLGVANSSGGSEDQFIYYLTRTEVSGG